MASVNWGEFFGYWIAGPMNYACAVQPLSELLDTLRLTFGYDEFRPLQGEIMEAHLAGKDTFALLPTGGGKSLCFQLPALVRPDWGLTVVVSPLIALMKDQVDQLQAAGVAATFLNSSLSSAEAKSRMAGLHRGEFRLLYVAPERLMLKEWQQNLTGWNVAALAIDEAHCVSEWGHDFRPEFRQIAQLRDILPEVPIMALTATATERVREDIIKHLRLREPEIFVASFNRPNISYKVRPKDGPARQITDFVKKRPQESGIVYCATRATTERTAEALVARGFSALPYHAGLPAEVRSENQELFLRDEVNIICATIAFGMGINKPNVRWVIHYDLPKNIESYYQETGRAGRDGLPSDCLLLFSAGDAAKQSHFIDDITDEHERSVARTQLRQMLHYAESAGCRRGELLTYFAETYPEANCASCDNCIEPRDTYDGTILAQKFLSCVYRVAQASRFGTGANHLVEILTGADTEKIRRWGHDQLSTYGIGKDLSRPHWLGVFRELMRLGYLRQTEGQYPTIEMTEAGAEILRARSQIMLTKPMTVIKTAKVRIKRKGAIECDEILFARLRALRKELADEKGVPAYVIFGDATLRQMAREYPETINAMHDIFGMGEKKREQYGDFFAAEIANHLQDNAKMAFN